MAAPGHESLTLELPVGTLSRIRESARRSHRPVERELLLLLEHALSAPDRLGKAKQRSHDEYQEYLRQSGQAQPTEEELSEQMRRIRQEVADELAPD